MKLPKYKICFKSFFKKGVPSLNDDFAIYLITGYQGSGKTYFAVRELLELPENKTIITNIQSLEIAGRKIFKFKNLQDIYKYDDDSCIYVIDEVSKRFTKDSKQDLQFYSWLQQSRKHRRYVYLITQEYLQVPTWLRGVANKVYTTKKLFGNLFITSLGFPVLNDESKEWETENFLYYVYKRNFDVSICYDTFEFINSL